MPSEPSAIAANPAATATGEGALRHSGRHPYPLPDLYGLAIQTFAVTMKGGSLFRTAVSAVPFLLPLMFQLGFGLDPF